MSAFNIQCVLFDLDGTLVDTAPDLVASVNHALQEYGYATADPVAVKPYVSLGAGPMIRSVTGEIDDAEHQQILNTMLDYYQANIAVHSRLFDGMNATLQQLEQAGLAWGVVTNKRERFTHPLMQALGLAQRAGCMVSGDTTAHSKPHPEPMFEACRRMGVDAQDCLYIGDAAHDISAGRAAHMKTLVATYGYLNADDQPLTWGADGLIDQPQQLFNWIAA